jgi:hypothetical protein
MAVYSLTQAGITNFVKYTNMRAASGPYVPPLSVQYLVIAGGGGGGSLKDGTGGGGAGGYRSSVSGELSGANSVAEAPLTLTLATNYSVTIGAGGAIATNGVDSIFSTITSIGGGKGGQRYFGNTVGNGGSGGGGGGSTAGGVFGFGTANQGFNGGGDPSNSTFGGGGGGAGVAGTNANGGSAGLGGNGIASNVTGSSVYRAGGGSGIRGGQPGATSLGKTAQGGGGHGDEAGNSGAIFLIYANTFTITIGAGLTGTTATVGANKVTTISAGTGNVSWAI